MQRNRAVGRALVGAGLTVLVIGIGGPALAGPVQGAPTPTPSPSAGGLPIGLNVGPIHVNLDLPLNLGGLLGAPAPSSSAVPTSAAPSTPVGSTRSTTPSAPRPTPAPSRGSSRRSDVVALPAPPAAAPLTTATRRFTATVTATKTAAPVKRHRAVTARSLLQSAFRPGNPVMLLGSVVVACALGVGTVVMLAGRGRRNPRAARHSR